MAWRADVATTWRSGAGACLSHPVPRLRCAAVALCAASGAPRNGLQKREEPKDVQHGPEAVRPVHLWCRAWSSAGIAITEVHSNSAKSFLLRPEDREHHLLQRSLGRGPEQVGRPRLPRNLEALADHVPDARVAEVIPRGAPQAIYQHADQLEEHDFVICRPTRNEPALDDAPREGVHRSGATVALGVDQPERHELIHGTEGDCSGLSIRGVRLYHDEERFEVGHGVELMQLVAECQLLEKTLEGPQAFGVEPFRFGVVPRAMLRQPQGREQVVYLVLHAFRRKFRPRNHLLHGSERRRPA
mmetsp:Transcript_86102/g.240767  ORF Transcript_86102/g.240767 Transcript_86102/m.240767 type:complete len:301 (-) Transcript_86102:30-932(-)